MEYAVHLIRHGITEGNQKKWHYGSMDIPLAKEGIEKIKELKREGIYPSALEKSCYTSGMLRTEQTFLEIFGEVDHREVEDLQEMKFGDFEGCTYEQLKDDDRYQRWIMDKKGDVKLPGGESKRDFYTRVDRGFENIIEEQKLRYAEKRERAEAVCVCHGGVIACLMLRCFPDSEKHFVEWIPEPGRGFVITFDMENGFDYKNL